jgi:hypothetical protein
MNSEQETIPNNSQILKAIIDLQNEMRNEVANLRNELVNSRNEMNVKFEVRCFRVKFGIIILSDNMRKYSFYFLIAVGTFGLGALSVFTIYWKISRPSETVQNKLENNSVTITRRGTVTIQSSNFISQENSISEKPVQNENFICREQVSAFLLSRLKKDLNTREFITDFIKEKRINNCSELFELEKEIDLNNDGVKEQIIRAKNTSKGMFLCGATGNCSTWILRRKNNSYQIILDAGSIEDIEIKDEITNGYKDLVTRGNSGAMNHYLGTFKFIGKKYQARKCVEEVTMAGGDKYFVRRNVSDCQ